ncbi:branched-chain amino acid ABC transporter substrate-binding protein [Delftia acidovorans]|uniref:Branched-chain amino acid ABC transporter substrate-binding protein n=1 Tax=Delftia acidovorans TaxID=80866 RepID=A0AAJ2V8Y6_DELAC|nr:branched-chain amino acid ABC transporter substrate-binding protein [Delftia acidovorans]MDX4952697.1 branched-chain amino acid ABC transporter substrate-binding protein [Delftia acidovorans]
MHASIRHFPWAGPALLCTMLGSGGLAWALPGSGPANGQSAGASAAAAVPSSADAPLVVRIAHAGPVSGPIASLGKDEENGVRMALDELNAKGLEIGGRKLRWKLEAGDDGGDPGQAVALARRLCDKKVAAVVGHLQSGTTLPATSIYHDCGIVMVTPAASNPAITQAGYDTTYRVIADDRAMVDALVAHAVGKLGVKRAAIIDDRSAYGQGIVALFEAEAREQGIEIVDKQFTGDKATDFVPILTAIKGKKPDAIFFGGLDAQAGPMLRQMAQLAMDKVRLLGGDGLCTLRLPELAGNTSPLRNVTCAVGGSPLERMPGGAAWKQRYDQRFPDQYQVFSPYAYDATMVLAQAMVRADSIRPDAYIPYLRQTRHDGVTAPIAFTPQGELQAPVVTLYHYAQGVRKPLP